VERRRVRGRESPECLDDGGEMSAKHHGLLDIVHCLWTRVRRTPVEWERPSPPHPAITAAVEIGVVKDGEEPGSQVRTRPELAASTKGPPVGLLDELFGLIRIAGQRLGKGTKIWGKLGHLVAQVIVHRV
jgi:hypothetical protein